MTTKRVNRSRRKGRKPAEGHASRKLPEVVGKPSRSLRVVGMFAGIGGLEKGLGTSGHHTLAFCEIEPAAQRVLTTRFPNVPLFSDIREMRDLPVNCDLVVGGFPCQDLSQAGTTNGITGPKSSIVAEMLDLVDKRKPPWVLIENVSNMLQLNKGHGIRFIVERLERAGYRWAYRVLNSLAFGVAQRRLRVFLLASLVEDPKKVLLADDAGDVSPPLDFNKHANGFYWTEGIRGLGWAVDAVPTLKGGSTVGIPSPPAVVLPYGRGVVKPTIQVAERLQGFEAGWTESAEEVVKRGYRWKLVGNAVTVPVAQWVGERLSRPSDRWIENDVRELPPDAKWPNAAFCDDPENHQRHSVKLSSCPKHLKRMHLLDYFDFDDDPPEPLSEKATKGFLTRAESSSSRFPEGFLEAVRKHLNQISKGKALAADGAVQGPG